MKRYSYGERDYAFGQAMLTLRTTIGLTQAGLAELFGISRRSVGEWEAGSSYPNAEHLKAFLVLCVRAAAFPQGREEEEIRALWKAAHQKVLLDEAWLSALLKQPSPPPTPVPVEESGGAEVGSAPTPAPTDSARASPPGQRPPSLEPVASRAPSGSGPRVESFNSRFFMERRSDKANQSDTIEKYLTTCIVSGGRPCRIQNHYRNGAKPCQQHFPV